MTDYKHIPKRVRVVLGRHIDRGDEGERLFATFDSDHEELTGVTTSPPKAPTDRLALIRTTQIAEYEYIVTEAQPVDFSDPENAYGDWYDEDGHCDCVHMNWRDYGANFCPCCGNAL